MRATTLNALLTMAHLVLSVNAGLSSDKNFELLILHNNDMHARFEETSPRSGVCKNEDRRLKKCVGGFSRVAHVVREARKASREGTGPKVIFLNAGDTYTGTSWFSVHRWKIVADFLNLLKPDVMSLGNHEFDNDIDGLVPFVQSARFPIVAANLDFSEEPTLQATNITKSVVLDVGEHRVGVIGYLTAETIKIASTGKVKFEDEVESVRKESEHLHEQGINIIIALGHSGYYVDQEVAKNVPLVDLVVGGHTNTFLWNGKQPDLEDPVDMYPLVIEQKSGKKVPVVQAYAYTKYMGKLLTKFDENGNLVEFNGQPILLENSIPQESDSLQLLEKFRPRVNEVAMIKIGKTKVLLDGGETCRLRECNFGNLAADAFVSHHAVGYGGAYWTDAPIGFMNGGSIRSVVEPKTIDGSITKSELLGALPFGDDVFSASINGSNLLQTLEIGARADGKTSRGEFLQVSGIQYTVDFSKPPFSRVSNVYVRCASCNIPTYEPLNLSKKYRLVATNFLINGGDGHIVLRDYKFDVIKENLTDIDIVVDYVTRHSPIFPAVENRITVLNSNHFHHNMGSSTIKMTPVHTLLLVLAYLLKCLV